MKKKYYIIICLLLVKIFIVGCHGGMTIIEDCSAHYNHKEEWLNGDMFLPIGSIVNVEGEQHKIMVIGYLAVPEFDTSLLFDYMGVYYPHGFENADDKLLFNRNQVIEIRHLGYNDENLFHQLQDLINAFLEE